MTPQSFLDAVAEVETGNNPLAIGKAGERSQFQISRLTWKQHTDQKFSLCGKYQSLTHVVAEKHKRWLYETYTMTVGRPPSIYDMAVMWNAGFSYYKERGFNRMRVNRDIRNYANRVENLHNEQTKLP